MGAIDTWALSSSFAGLMKAARLRELEITDRQMRVFREAPARYWYVSRIVLRPELIGRRAIRIPLLREVGFWLSNWSGFVATDLTLRTSLQRKASDIALNGKRSHQALTPPENVWTK